MANLIKSLHKNEHINKKIIAFLFLSFLLTCLCRYHTSANLTATPLQINSQWSLSAVSVESPWSLRRVAEHGESSANALRIDFY